MFPAGAPVRRRDRVLAVIFGVLSIGVITWFAHSSSGRSAVPAGDVLARTVVADVPVTDAEGARWTPGNGFVGGHLAEVGQVSGTGSPSLYATALIGVRSYRLPVADGVYDVALLFADGSCESAGCRRFDVRIQGTVVARGLDIVSLAGPRHPFSIVQRAVVSDGALDVTFTPRVGETTVSAVEVVHAHGGAGLMALWSQAFDGPAGTAPEPVAWAQDIGGGGWGNAELQDYTNSPTTAALDGHGNLSITARKGVLPDGTTTYTSARLETKSTLSFRYGVLRARVRLPLGRGLWPALWMVGDDIEKVGWPQAGEIDVLEGNGAEPGYSWFHIHGPDVSGKPYSIGQAHVGDSSTAADFHDYELTWTPVGFGLSIDGQPVYGITRADLSAGQQWVFDRPFRLVINLAVGGTFVGSPDASTPFPASMDISYIRVLQ